MSGYIYIFQPREFLHTNTYKIGRTYDTQKRLQQYPKGTRSIMSFYVDDMVYAEKLVLNEFKSFIVKDYGKEYISIERDLLVTRLQIIFHDFIFGKIIRASL